MAAGIDITTWRRLTSDKPHVVFMDGWWFCATRALAIRHVKMPFVHADDWIGQARTPYHAYRRWQKLNKKLTQAEPGQQ